MKRKFIHSIDLNPGTESRIPNRYIHSGSHVSFLCVHLGVCVGYCSKRDLEKDR
jgi:hypothetical protein